MTESKDATKFPKAFSLDRGVDTLTAADRRKQLTEINALFAEVNAPKTRHVRELRVFFFVFYALLPTLLLACRRSPSCRTTQAAG